MKSTHLVILGILFLVFVIIRLPSSIYLNALSAYGLEASALRSYGTIWEGGFIGMEISGIDMRFLDFKLGYNGVEIDIDGNGYRLSMTKPYFDRLELENIYLSILSDQLNSELSVNGSLEFTADSLIMGESSECDWSNLILESHSLSLSIQNNQLPLSAQLVEADCTSKFMRFRLSTNDDQFLGELSVNATAWPMISYELNTNLFNFNQSFQGNLSL